MDVVENLKSQTEFNFVRFVFVEISCERDCDRTGAQLTELPPLAGGPDTADPMKSRNTVGSTRALTPLDQNAGAGHAAGAGSAAARRGDRKAVRAARSGGRKVRRGVTGGGTIARSQSLPEVRGRSFDQPTRGGSSGGGEAERRNREKALQAEQQASARRSPSPAIPAPQSRLRQLPLTPCAAVGCHCYCPGPLRQKHLARGRLRPAATAGDGATAAQRRPLPAARRHLRARPPSRRLGHRRCAVPHPTRQFASILPSILPAVRFHQPWFRAP